MQHRRVCRGIKSEIEGTDTDVLKQQYVTHLYTAVRRTVWDVTPLSGASWHVCFIRVIVFAAMYAAYSLGSLT